MCKILYRIFQSSKKVYMYMLFTHITDDLSIYSSLSLSLLVFDLSTGCFSLKYRCVLHSSSKLSSSVFMASCLLPKICSNKNTSMVQQRRCQTEKYWLIIGPPPKNKEIFFPPNKTLNNIYINFAQMKNYTEVSTISQL